MSRVVVASVLVTLLPGFTLAFWDQLHEIIGNPEIAAFLLGGAILGVIFDHFLVRKAPFLATFEHELTHAIAALMFFRLVTRFVVIRGEGGYIRSMGGFGGAFGDDFIGLAPYLFPTFTFFFSLVRPALPAGWFPWFDGWVGFTFGFHLWSTVAEIKRNWHASFFQVAGATDRTQSDIGSRGFIYSTVFILSLTLAFHGVVLAVIQHDYSGFLVWLESSWSGSLRVFDWFLNFLPNPG